MGARPIACLNALSFGAPEHPKTRHLVSGVVAGVGGYGNSFGVPRVGGQVASIPGMRGNILVNAMAAGLADAEDKIFYAAASGVNMPIVYLGSKTGRDGIHGASMASAEYDDEFRGEAADGAGDPFAEKLLLEACLEIMAANCVDSDPGHGRGGVDMFCRGNGRQGDFGVDLHSEFGADARNRHER